MSAPAKPALLPLNAAGIPPDLRAVRAWVGWKWKLERNGRWTKVPVNVKTGRLAETDDDKTWSDFDMALQNYKRVRCDGIGLCRAGDLVFIDCDGVFDANGDLLAFPWVEKILSALRGRVHLERSVTGTGFHGIGRVTLPPGRRQFDDPTRTHTGYGFYDKNRLFTFSGNILPGSGEICDVTAELADLHRELFPVATTNYVAATHRTVRASSAAALSDAELIERARCAKNNTKFSRLFDGDRTGYPSQSEADMALLRMLAFWTGRDAARMTALFRRSGLYRKKSGRADYINGTIEKAIAETVEVFSQASSEKPVMASDDLVEPSAALLEIRVAGRELRDLSAQVLAALTAANQPIPKLFSRAGAVVRVDLTKDGGPMIINVTDVHLRGEMTRAANCFKIIKTKDGLVRTSISPPLDTAKDLLSRPPQELDFPGLEYISESPFRRPDGTVVCQPGYDPITRTFYAPSGPLDGLRGAGTPYRR